jgi:hypothetical protein
LNRKEALGLETSLRDANTDGSSMLIASLPPVDEELGVHPVFVSLPREDLIYLKVLLESFEGIGVMRSEEPFYESNRALVVLLIVPDSAADALRLLNEVRGVTALAVESVERSRIERLRRDLLGELSRP